MNNDLAVQLALAQCRAFLDSTQVGTWKTNNAYTVVSLTVTDTSNLTLSLARLAAELDGLDWAADDPEFIDDCVAAGLDYEALLAVPVPHRVNAARDLQRKEIGDLAELLALMKTLACDDFDPALVFPKNALKLYQRISEPGVDVIALKMNVGASGRSLQEADRMHLIEVKASGTQAFESLAADAAQSMQAVTVNRIQRELRLIRANLLSRGGGAAALRIPQFMLEFHRRSEAVVRHAFLTTEVPASDPFDAADLDGLADGVVLCEVDVRSLRTDVFAYRRRS